MSLHFRGALLMFCNGWYIYTLHTVMWSCHLFNHNKGFCWGNALQIPTEKKMRTQLICQNRPWFA